MLEVRLTGSQPAIIRGVTQRPPAVLAQTDSPAEALAALGLHDRAKCFEGDKEISHDELLARMQARERNLQAETEAVTRIRQGQPQPAQHPSSDDSAPTKAKEVAAPEATKAKEAAAPKPTQAPTVPPAPKELPPAPQEATTEASKADGPTQSEAAPASSQEQPTPPEAAQVVAEEAPAPAQAADSSEEEQTADSPSQEADSSPQEAAPIPTETEGDLAQETAQSAPQEASEAPQEELLALREGDVFPHFNVGSQKLQEFAESYGISPEALWAHGSYRDVYAWLKGRFELS